MLGRVVNPKYVDLGSLIVDVYIVDNLISKTLIDLGVSINVMNQNTMMKLAFRTY